MHKRAVVLIAALSAWGCGLPVNPNGTTGGSGSTSGGSSGGTCTLTGAFDTVGQLGSIQYSATATPPYVAELQVEIEDYPTTCGAENFPPSYSAQNYWHGVGFQIENPGQAGLPLTVNYPGGSGAPSFEGCSFGDGVGSNGPTGLACGGSYLCQSGSTVTVTSASATSASGNYALVVSNGVGSPLNLSGTFNISANCTSL